MQIFSCFSFVFCLLLLGLSQAQTGAVVTGTTSPRDEISLAIPPVSQPRAKIQSHSIIPAQQFECDGKFTLERCKEEVPVLKPLLSKYGAAQLGGWKWVLMRSQDWELLLARLGVSSNVPAFTALERRVTFFDETLVEGSPGRLSELRDAWDMAREGLLDLAVRHELGHALCDDPSEFAADRAAKRLEDGKAVGCDPAALPKKSKNEK